MKTESIPMKVRADDKLILAGPDIGRLFELHDLIRNFGPEHKFISSISSEDSLEDTAKHLIKAVDDFASDKDYEFHILQKIDGALVGCVGLHERRNNVQNYEIGYWIGAGYSGQGYATRACIMARDIALTMFKPNRIEILAQATNKASRRVAEKAGFVFEVAFAKYYRDNEGELDEGCVYSYPI